MPTSMKSRTRFLVLDASALIHRAYHALPPLTSPAGRPVGALYGLAATLLHVLKAFKPTHVAAALDRPERTFRHEKFEAYKAQRAETPEDLLEQITRAGAVFRAFGIPVVDAKGYEADDVIGTLTKKASAEGVESIIVTGDQDTLQLIDVRTRVFMLRRGIKDTVTMGPEDVRERFGLTPDQMIDYKALRGDPSDNIPGVRGVGEKTATELLRKYETVSGVYRHLKELPGSLQEKLKGGREAARMSRDLVTIERGVKLPAKLPDLKWTGYDRPAAVALLQELGFSSLLPRLPEQPRSSAAPGVQGALLAASGDTRAKRRTEGYTLVRSAAEATRVAAALANVKAFVVDTETDVLGARTATLHGISLSTAEASAWYVPASFVPAFKEVLENPRIEKWGHNLKYDFSALLQAGIRTIPLAFDTMLASYILSPGTRAHTLDTLVFTVLGHEMIPIEALIGKKSGGQKRLSDVPLDDVAEYSAEDADYTLRLVTHFRRELEKIPTLQKVFTEIELPLVPILAHMELAGVRLDVPFLERLGADVGKKLRKLETLIHRHAGTTFNINSPAQLREILFDRLKLPTTGIGRTQTGLSTAAEELDKLREAHPIIAALTEYRELSKLKGTYLDALPTLVDAKTGRVYTSYNQTVAATGRLSSSDPNLQNIPIRTELGGEIRKAFIAERGNVLVALDYSQLELRLAAHIAKDAAMRDVFRRGGDIHVETAAFAFDTEPAAVTKEQRRKAKTLNFGVLYGMGPQAFSRAADIPFGEAQAFIAEYMATYRGIAEYMEEVVALAASQGYVETIYGRRRYLPEIQSRNPQIRSSAERMAINHPIQGTESDVIKRAMIALFGKMEGGDAAFYNAKLILQVHDELVFEVPRAQAEQLGRTAKRTMERLERLSVPLIVDVRVGKNWGEMKPLSASHA
jgi:DNA polymerase I